MLFRRGGPNKRIPVLRFEYFHLDVFSLELLVTFGQQTAPMSIYCLSLYFIAKKLANIAGETGKDGYWCIIDRLDRETLHRVTSFEQTMGVKISDRLCPLVRYGPPLQSTCHYVVNHHVKIWHVRWGVSNNMQPVSWCGTNGKDPKFLKEFLEVFRLICEKLCLRPI